MEKFYWCLKVEYPVILATLQAAHYHKALTRLLILPLLLVVVVVGYVCVCVCVCVFCVQC